MASFNMKVCSKCGVLKLAGEFSPRKDRPVGLYSCCKSCKGLSRKQRRIERKAQDPETLWFVDVLNGARDRARRKGLVFALSREWLMQKMSHQNRRCIYCEITFNFRRTTKTRRDSPTLDRVNQLDGYIESNVVLACHRCNALKSDATSIELRRIADTMEVLKCKIV